MKRKLIIIMVSALLALCLAAFSGCALFENTPETQATIITSSDNTDGTSAGSSETEAEKLPDPIDDTKTATGDFSITAKDGTAITPDGTVYKITAAGEYTATGKLDGQILVDADDDADIVIILSSASVSCADDAPILVKNAGEVTVRAAEGTYNTVTDQRAGDPSATEESEENCDAAIYSTCDLKINGLGTLIVCSEYDNGVKSKDDVKIKEVTLKVTAPGNAVKGNDSVTIESGNLILVSTEGDCIKTSNSDVSTKGNQRGTITISGGHVDVYSAQDGISAAYNVEISEGSTVNIFTASYADIEVSTGAASDLYLIVPRSTYSNTTDYYAYFYNDDDTAGVWEKFEYDSMVYSGRTSYYGLLTRAPDGYQNVIFNTLSAGVTPDGENYTASSGGGTRNTAMNGYLITGISSGVISGDWVQLTSGSGSTNKTSFSSKGVKAANEIIIDGGDVAIYCMDDGLHANADGKLENGSTAAGNITVNGGSVTIRSADDGMHADGKLTINGGTVNVAEAHEGLEGNVIEINGGSVTVYGNDDGLNACKGTVTPLINITGGYVDVTTPSGDTDAIDANGNFTVSGGFILVKGGASSGNVAGSVDVDGSITVTGGTIVALGGICETPKTGSVCTYISSGTSFSAGSYVLKDSSGNEIFAFTLSSSYSSCWIASDAIALNGSYTVARDGTSVLSWTQSSSTVGSAGSWGGGFRPGGRT